MNLLLFLGGTTHNSTWREDLIPFLKYENLAYFNPVVDDWNDEAFEREMFLKSQPNTVELYVITKEMKGVFSIAEAVEASNKKPDKTIFIYIPEGFDESQVKSLEATKKIIEKNGAHIAHSLYEVALIFKGICTEENSEDIKNRLAYRRKSFNLEKIFNNLEAVLKNGKSNLSYERIFDKLGVTDLLNKMYINTNDLSKGYRDAIHKNIIKFLKNPLFKDIDLDNEEDLKFLSINEGFENFLEGIFENIQNKLSSYHSKVLDYIKNKEKDTKIDIDQLVKDTKIDKVSIMFILDDLIENKKIYDFNGREITLN